MTNEQLKEHAEGLQRDYDLLLAEFRLGRNHTLEEVAQAFEHMASFGDTAQSFAVYVRNMKS